LEAASIAPLQGTEFAIAAVNNGVQPELRLYLNTLANAAAGKGGWRPICTVEDAVTGFVSRGAEIFLLSHRDAPHFQVLRVTADAPEISSATVVVPESEAILQNLYVGRDALYIHDMKDGVDRLRRRGDDGAVTQVAMPHAGSITLVSADAERDGLIFGLRSWLSSNAIFALEADGSVRATDLTPPSAFDPSGFASEELLVTARDGVSVPLSIVYRKGMVRDGSAPTLITAYGAYGLSVTPNNQTMMAFPLNLAFLERGGVWAIAHVRGGGERGLEWHEAGKLLNKHRSWEDLIDCAEYLITERWTSPARLAVHGRSAGAIPMGRAITERPDLFAVGISNVGVHNSLRGEFTPNGPANTPEFGSNATEEGFLGLRSSDSCAHVRAGVGYPAVLLTTGMTDRRVAPWLVAKFAAHLQAASTSGRPVLMRVDFQAGHGVGSTREQRDAELADMFGFILWQTGGLP
ncbi:MAG: prolyl oligopeptidase family serine peptidase, partial [Candidatus Eisenbacteria bacterium]|nr:prolyl oligopeptidase family serine peptidase [Candidatus Eisenbacteria bacterium]